MFWNVILAVLAAFNQLFVAWLGWKVSANPKLLKDPRKKKLCEIAFWVFGFIGIGLVAIITYRSGLTERVHVSHEIRETYGPNFIPIGEPLAFNIWMETVGNGTAHDIATFSRTFIGNDLSLYSENEVIEQFERWLLTAEVPAMGTTLTPGMKRATTADGAILSPEDHENLKSGRKVVYIMGLIQFRDDFGKRTQRVCQKLQPPETGGIVIFQSCSRYNDEISGWRKALRKS